MIINIDEKLKRTPSFIVLGGKSYTVDKSKNIVTKVMAYISESDSIESIDKCIKLLVGEEAYEIASGLDFEDYKTVFQGILAAATGKTLEETQKESEDNPS